MPRNVGHFEKQGQVPLVADVFAMPQWIARLDQAVIGVIGVIGVIVKFDAVAQGVNPLDQPATAVVGTGQQDALKIIYC